MKTQEPKVRFYTDKYSSGYPWRYFVEVIFPDGEKVTKSPYAGDRTKWTSLRNGRNQIIRIIESRGYKVKKNMLISQKRA